MNLGRDVQYNNKNSSTRLYDKSRSDGKISLMIRISRIVDREQL